MDLFNKAKNLAATLLAEDGRNEGGESSVLNNGITPNLLEYLNNVCEHPRTFVDFPMKERGARKFRMSQAQQQHAIAVLEASRSLAGLRYKLVPGSISDGKFWAVYFMLAHKELQHVPGLEEQPCLSSGTDSDLDGLLDPESPAGDAAALLDGAELEVLDGAELEVLDGAELEVLDGAELEVLDGAELEVLDGAEVDRAADVDVVDGAVDAEAPVDPKNGDNNDANELEALEGPNYSADVHVHAEIDDFDDFLEDISTRIKP